MTDDKFGQKVGDTLLDPRNNRIWKGLLWLLAILLLVDVALGWYWSWEPDLSEVNRRDGAVAGETMTREVIHVASPLLDKPGGYLRNDVMPPGLWLDNMPNWEAGVTRQVRDAVTLLGESLSAGDAPLAQANESLAGDLESWRWPASETVLRAARNNLGEAFTAVENAAGSSAPNQDAAAEPSTQLDAAALSDWLAQVQQRLETQTRQLAANVGQSPNGDEQDDSTPWLRIDNVFFEARGTTWALAQLMQAARIDYADAIESSGVGADVDQLVAELESSQARVWSPVILNGSGFGLFANHSLMMANYTVRASHLDPDKKPKIGRASCRERV